MSEKINWDDYRGSAADLGPAMVAASLAPQLGSDQNYIAQGKTDMRRLTVLDKKDLLFLLYAKLRSRKSRVWETLYDEYLNLKVSVGGRGRRDIIRMEGVSKGGMASVESEIIKQPGLFARNIWDREWDRKGREAREL